VNGISFRHIGATSGEILPDETNIPIVRRMSVGRRMPQHGFGDSSKQFIMSRIVLPGNELSLYRIEFVLKLTKREMNRLFGMLFVTNFTR